MNSEMKFRHELKYQCSIVQINTLKNRLKNIILPDSHAGENGQYTIRSLYFDSMENTCFFENENGTDPREKFRIRIYNSSSDRIILECKRKERGKTHKTSCLISLEDYRVILGGCNFFNINELPPLLRKFMILVKTQLYRPAVIVEYDRTPLICDQGNVRITLDTNIRSSFSVSDFFENELPSRPIMPCGQHLLEVKYDEFLPDYIKDALQIEGLQCTAYSKYYLCKKFSMRGLL